VQADFQIDVTCHALPPGTRPPGGDAEREMNWRGSWLPSDFREFRQLYA
jgi:hypothetical protein